MHLEPCPDHKPEIHPPHKDKDQEREFMKQELGRVNWGIYNHYMDNRVQPAQWDELPANERHAWEEAAINVVHGLHLMTRVEQLVATLSSEKPSGKKPSHIPPRQKQNAGNDRKRGKVKNIILFGLLLCGLLCIGYIACNDDEIERTHSVGG